MTLVSVMPTKVGIHDFACPLKPAVGGWLEPVLARAFVACGPAAMRYAALAHRAGWGQP